MPTEVPWNVMLPNLLINTSCHVTLTGNPIGPSSPRSPFRPFNKTQSYSLGLTFRPMGEIYKLWKLRIKSSRILSVFGDIPVNASENRAKIVFRIF